MAEAAEGWKGAPFPTLGDGTRYRPEHVVLAGDGRRGRIAWVEWCHRDGSFMAAKERMTTAKTPRLRPGAWWAVVAWFVQADRSSRVPLRDLLDGGAV